MPIRGSAAWVITIVMVTAFLVGALLLTALDPVAQGLMSSPLWSGDTTYSQMALSAMGNIWTYVSLFILIGFLSKVWITTRRAG